MLDDLSYSLLVTKSSNRCNSVLAAPNAFMACINVRKEQPRNEPSIKVPPCVAKTPKDEALRPNISTSMLNTETSTSFLKKKPTASVVNAPAVEIPRFKSATASGKPVVSVEIPPKADLMDLDIGQETLQPVLQFTAAEMKMQPEEPIVEEPSSFDQKIEALERSGVLNATQLEALKSIQDQVHARANPPTLAQEAPNQAIRTRSELEFLRAAAGSPKVTTGIARQFSEQQRAFLIGEHVHKTRYHAAVSLPEEFEKLSILDKNPAEPAPTDVANTEKLEMISDKKPAESVASNLSGTEKSKINPFGPQPGKGKGPSLPAHLLNQTAIADHGAAARTQYSCGDNALAPVSNKQPLGGSAVPTRPTRRNKINDTGFIALAENHAVGKKKQDPFLASQKRGL